MDSTLSMSVRLRRVRTETTTVSVPITEEVMRSGVQAGQVDGPKINVDKVIEAALKLGSLDTTTWESEGPAEIQLHPIQNTPEPKTTIQ